MVRLVFHQPLRQTEGLLGSLQALMDIELPISVLQRCEEGKNSPQPCG